MIPLPRPVPPVLAVGAYLKNTICVTSGDRAVLSLVHGDLGTPKAIAAFEASVESLVREMGVAPVCVAHDLHPDFHSTRFAQTLDLPAVAVQHHHAHTAAVAAEHGIDSPVLGLCLDGFGLGPDNQAWGGELLLVEGPRYRRLGHFAPLAQPGGDIAAREPWRMASAVLFRLGRGDEIATRFADQPSAKMLARVIERQINARPTSSAGRLFDAACGLLGLFPVAAFEGQAPQALERLVTRPEVLADSWWINDGVLDFLPLLETLAACDAPVRGANLFHGTLIAALTQWCSDAAEASGIDIVTLGGGCFFNRVLAEGLAASLTENGLRPLTAVKVSPGDPGLSYGQAWIAGQFQE